MRSKARREKGFTTFALTKLVQCANRVLVSSERGGKTKGGL